MFKQLNILILSLLFSLLYSLQYTNVYKQLQFKKNIKLHSLLDDSSMIHSLIQVVPPDQAKGDFFFFFFFGSGALGIGAVQLPKLIARNKAFQSLKGGPTEGGETIGNIVTSIVYPEPLYKKDVEKIIKNIPSVSILQSKGPKKSFIAQQGFIEKEGFFNSLSKDKYNPLALFAVFDALSSGNGDLASPEFVELSLNKYRQVDGGLNSFINDLSISILKKFSAYVVFAFLIALVLDLIIESGINGYLR